MQIKLIPGPRDEKMITLVRETLANCQHVDGSATCSIDDDGSKVRTSNVPCLCNGCNHATKYGCDIMKLCHRFGYDKIYDAIYYGFNGDEQTLRDIEEFEWESMTQECYDQYISWLSKDAIMEIEYEF